MAKNIEPNLKLISEYLKLKKEENFVIPEYQRNYSWGTTECDKLWQDLEVFISSSINNDTFTDPYFFGTIIIDCSLQNKFSLIDGQQRTITFFLLLKAMLLRLNEAISSVPDDEDSEALKAGLKAKRSKIMGILYKAQDEDIPSMLKDPSKTKNILIVENKSINELYPNEVSIIIGAENYESAERQVYKIPRKQKDNKYTNYFRNFKFFYTKLSEKSESQLNQFVRIFLDCCQVIEIRSWQIEQAITMFNSLNSTGVPLTDADIISAQLYAKAGTNKDKFNQMWKVINTITDNLNNNKITDVTGILQQFMYINRAKNKEYVSEAGSIDVTTPGLRRYYTEIKKELLDDPLSLCNNLSKIANIWNKVKDYPIVKLLLKFNENAKLFFISYLYRYELEEISEESVLDIAECLIRLFTLLELSDFSYSSYKFKTFLFSENIKLVDGGISIKEIKKDFDDHINKNWDEQNIREFIYDYDKNLLVFLNEYIYSKNKGVRFDFIENVNIEHIMPASGRNIDIIKRDAGITDSEEFESIVSQLGNKILLEEDINKSISNEWFKTKKQTSIKDKTGYKDSKYSIAKSLTFYPKDVWTKEDIEKATQKATERILKFIFNK